MEEKVTGQDDCSLMIEKRQKLLGMKEKMLRDPQQEQKATELLAVKYKAVESELLLWGKNIMNHTKERQKTLKLKSEEIAEQKYHGQEIQQEVMI